MWSWYTILITVLTTIYIFFKYRYQHWKNKNVPYLDPIVPIGDLKEIFTKRQQIGFFLKNIFDLGIKRQVKHIGVYFFASPFYIPIDLDYIKNILTKDFQHFTDRTNFYNEKDDPLSAHLFAINGQKWRNLRTKISPTFTSGRIKAMLSTVLQCERVLQEVMLDQVKKSPVFDVKDILARFTTDIIGSVGFGLDFNTFKEPNSPFRTMGQKITTGGPGFFIRAFVSTLPGLALKFGVRDTPKDIEDFFLPLVRDTVKYREDNKIVRNDFLQLLIQLKNDNNDGNHDGTSLTIEEIAAECFVFFLAGFDTSSATMTFALFELAKNPEIQEKLRVEIRDVLEKFGNEITYDAIQEMTYLNLVVNETLRKYPPISILVRKCVKDYKLPDDETQTIDKGTPVMIPVYGIHHNEKYYPDPEKFDPERFTEENKKNRHPCAFLPFGDGPRNCIGMRFALVQTKVGLISMVKNFKFAVDSRTNEPLQFQSGAPILTVVDGIWLKAEKI